MDRRHLKITASVLYFICFVSVSGMLSKAIGIVTFVHSEKIFLGVIAVITGYSAACFRCLTIEGEERRKKVIRRHLVILFLFYIVMLTDFTLIDDSLGRNIYNVFKWNGDALEQYINNSTNLIPFATVKLFVNGYINGRLPLYPVCENILGNIIAFMPFSFFLPCLFKNFEKCYAVFVAVLLTVMLVELLQFVFLTGSSDIDDVILNTSGAMLFYALIRQKTIAKGIKKLTFGVWEIENKG